MNGKKSGIRKKWNERRSEHIRTVLGLNKRCERHELESERRNTSASTSPSLFHQSLNTRKETVRQLVALLAAAAATAGVDSSNNSSLRSFLEVLQEKGMENLVKRLDPSGAHSPELLRYLNWWRQDVWLWLSLLSLLVSSVVQW